MGIPVIAGRSLTPQDTADSLPVAVVNKAMATAFLAQRESARQTHSSPIGSLRPSWLTIVGIVGDVRHLGPIRDVFFEVYVPYTQPVMGLARGAPFPFPRELVVRTDTRSREYGLSPPAASLVDR